MKLILSNTQDSQTMGSSESKREEEDVVEIEEDGEFDRPDF